MKLPTIGKLFRSANQREASKSAKQPPLKPVEDGVDPTPNLLQRILRKYPSRPKPPQPQSALVELPVELQQKILEQLSAQDMAAMKATCKTLRAAAAPLWQTRTDDLPWHVASGPMADKRGALQRAAMADTALAKVRRQRDQGDIEAVQAYAEAMFDKIIVTHAARADDTRRDLGRDTLTRYSLLAHTNRAFWATEEALALIFEIADQTGRVGEAEALLQQILKRSKESLKDVWLTVIAGHHTYVDACLPHGPSTPGEFAYLLFRNNLAHAVEATLALCAIDWVLMEQCIKAQAWACMKVLLNRHPDTAGIWADDFLSHMSHWDDGAQEALRDLVARGVGGRLRLEDLARVQCNVEAAEFLATLDIDFDQPDLQGRRCLHGSVDKKDVDLLAWLLRRGCDPNAADAQGRTALHRLASSEDDSVTWQDRTAIRKMLKLLVEHGADLHLADAQGDTPLHAARNRFFVAEAIACGADINVVNHAGRFVLEELRTQYPAEPLVTAGIVAHVARTGTAAGLAHLIDTELRIPPEGTPVMKAAWLMFQTDETMCTTLRWWTERDAVCIDALVGIAYHMGCTFSECDPRLKKLVHALASCSDRKVGAVAFEYIKLAGESLDSKTFENQTPLSLCSFGRSFDLIDLGARQSGGGPPWSPKRIKQALARPDAYQSRAQSLSEILTHLLKTEL